MGQISSHTNVYNTCLRILRKKNFELWVDGELDNEEIIIPESLSWHATKDDFSFYADNPIELLGLVTIYEFKQPVSDESYWWTVEGDNIRDELLDAAFQFEDK